MVADKVRKLAEKTMASTTDVANAITAIQTGVNNSLDQVAISAQAIAEATDCAEPVRRSTARNRELRLGRFPF